MSREDVNVFFGRGCRSFDSWGGLLCSSAAVVRRIGRRFGEIVAWLGDVRVIVADPMRDQDLGEFS